jgi:hypothetical protein
VTGLRITPNVPGEQVALGIAIMGGGNGAARLNVQIEPPSAKPIVREADLDLETGQVHNLELSVPIPAPELWDIDTPHLYTVVLTPTGPDGDQDIVRSYFGIRQVEQREGQVWLNGRPVYLMTALDQGYWPDGLYTAPDDENARSALTRIHNLGAGEHGDLVEITVPQELLPEIQADARGQAHFRLRLEVKPTAPKPGGLTLFGTRAGRYGTSPTITMRLNPLP